MFWTKTKVNTDPQAIDEFLSRGVEGIFPDKEHVRKQLLSGKRLTAYLGVDPTSPTLHVGHMIPILKLADFQALGHRVILLVGDFTATIGDPTGKDVARKTLTHRQTKKNAALYREQVGKFLSFEGANKARFVWNSTWLARMDFRQILDLTSKITVDQMLKRDMFARRKENNQPISLHEFMYPLMQGYDSVALDVDGEFGGNDQTFNMLIGRDLQKIYKNKDKFVIATKLLVDEQGKKMSKSEGGAVSLDLGPAEIFGRIMSWPDELIVPAFEVCTRVPMDKISEFKAIVETGNPRDAKMLLAQNIVSTIHGPKEAAYAKDQFIEVFQKKSLPDNIQEYTFQEARLTDFVSSNNIFESKSEFRRLILAGAVEHVGTGVDKDPNQVTKNGTYRIGKTTFFKVV